MRFATLSLDFGLLLLVIVAFLHTHGANANGEEKCPTRDCLSADKCEIQATGSCRNSGDVCCSLVKKQYRTLCRHWSGECMDRCNKNIIRRSTDCPSNQVCCVLV